MTRKTKYFRFNYDSDATLSEMLEGGTILPPKILLPGGKNDPAQYIEKELRIGDAVLLARFDVDECAGVVVAMGFVENEKPATKVRWQKVNFKVHPNPQGGAAQWKKERCFKFDDEPVKRYGLAATYLKYFPK